jgi:hypothetical protein
MVVFGLITAENRRFCAFWEIAAITALGWISKTFPGMKMGRCCALSQLPAC